MKLTNDSAGDLVLDLSTLTDAAERLSEATEEWQAASDPEERRDARDEWEDAAAEFAGIANALATQFKSKL